MTTCVSEILQLTSVLLVTCFVGELWQELWLQWRSDHSDWGCRGKCFIPHTSECISRAVTHPKMVSRITTIEMLPTHSNNAVTLNQAVVLMSALHKSYTSHSNHAVYANGWVHILRHSCLIWLAQASNPFFCCSLSCDNSGALLEILKGIHVTSCNKEQEKFQQVNFILLISF